MTKRKPEDQEALAIAQRWCEAQGDGWRVNSQLGRGGTAPVFELETPEGVRALKINNPDFSEGQVDLDRITKQLELRGHNCEFLVDIFDGGEFEGRLYVLMSRADGTELADLLDVVPRTQIRQIVDQVARAAIYLEGRGLCHRDIKAENVFVSRDYSRATLLDISVIRDIRDPIGVGTDHEGQLPVVATARYSPPEYLFRLLEPGPKLWHALTVYQLGALLHDLIMRESMFRAEFSASSQNRYRFAWIVATQEPLIEASDVDDDLLLLARRALDKDWKRRSSLALEDFLSDASVGQRHALELLGVGISAPAEQHSLASRVRRVTEVSRELEEMMHAYLKEKGIQARHRVNVCPSDTSKQIVLEWEAPSLARSELPIAVQFKLTLSLTEIAGQSSFEVTATLVRSSEGGERLREMTLPPFNDADDASSRISKEAETVFVSLATQLARRLAQEP